MHPPPDFFILIKLSLSWYRAWSSCCTSERQVLLHLQNSSPEITFIIIFHFIAKIHLWILIRNSDLHNGIFAKMYRTFNALWSYRWWSDYQLRSCHHTRQTSNGTSGICPIRPFQHFQIPTSPSSSQTTRESQQRNAPIPTSSELIRLIMLFPWPQKILTWI